MNAAYDIDGVRRQFPILGRTVYGLSLIHISEPTRRRGISVGVCGV